MLNSTANYPSDGAENGGSVSGEDEFGGDYYESRPRTKKGKMYNSVGMDSVDEYCDSRNGCAALEASVGGHIADLNTAVATV